MSQKKCTNGVYPVGQSTPVVFTGTSLYQSGPPPCPSTHPTPTPNLKDANASWSPPHPYAATAVTEELSSILCDEQFIFYLFCRCECWCPKVWSSETEAHHDQLQLESEGDSVQGQIKFFIGMVYLNLNFLFKVHLLLIMYMLWYN
jgi:hypothetical protein